MKVCVAGKIPGREDGGEEHAEDVQEPWRQREARAKAEAGLCLSGLGVAGLALREWVQGEDTEPCPLWNECPVIIMGTLLRVL